MLGSIQSIQLDVMLFVCGLCTASALFMAFSKSFDRERKLFLILTNLFSVLLLSFDRAYIYRGDTSRTGYWMVRISNFIVFTMTLLIAWGFNHYVRDIIVDETGVKKVPFRLKLTGDQCTITNIRIKG